jgi:hypothetical protein
VGQYTGPLSNLSEGGFAVNGLFPEIQDEVCCLALDLENSGFGFPLRATAQTAWTNAAENRTGLRFVSLPANSRQQLREWISAHGAATVKEHPPQAFRFPARDAQFDFAAIRRQLTAGVIATELEVARREDRLLRLMGLCLTAMTLLLALVFLGYSLGSRGDRPTQVLAPAGPDLPAAALAEPAEISPTTSPLPSTVPLDVPGFVLQVAAMRYEANADGLSEILQENDFPAFVFKRNSDRFYKVAVGSFADAESAAVVKRKLEKRGFKVILRHWSPQ